MSELEPWCGSCRARHVEGTEECAAHKSHDHPHTYIRSTVESEEKSVAILDSSDDTPMDRILEVLDLKGRNVQSINLRFSKDAVPTLKVEEILDDKTVERFLCLMENGTWFQMTSSDKYKERPDKYME